MIGILEYSSISSGSCIGGGSGCASYMGGDGERFANTACSVIVSVFFTVMHKRRVSPPETNHRLKLPLTDYVLCDVFVPLIYACKLALTRLTMCVQ